MKFESLPIELIVYIISFSISCKFKLLCKIIRISKTIKSTINNNFKYISSILETLHISNYKANKLQKNNIFWTYQKRRNKISFSNKSKNNVEMMNCVKTLDLDDIIFLNNCKLLFSLINLTSINVKINEDDYVENKNVIMLKDLIPKNKPNINCNNLAIEKRKNSIEKVNFENNRNSEGNNRNIVGFKVDNNILSKFAKIGNFVFE